MVTIFNNDRNSNQNNTESSSYFHQKVNKKNHKGQYMLVRMWYRGGCTPPKQVSLQTGTNTLENNLQVIRKLELVLAEDLTTLLLDIYPKDSPPYHKDMCSSMFIAALLVIARN